MNEPGSGKTREPRMRRILCLHLPNWPIQRVLAGHSRGHERSEMHQPAAKVHCASLMHPTLILHTRDPRRGQIVVAASDAARQCGIRLGMPLAEAATLANRSPHAPRQEFISRSEMPTMTLPHDPATDLAELARLAEHCERFSPLVG